MAAGSGRVRIKGLREIQQTFRKLDKEMQGDFKNVVHKHTESVAKSAKARVPVDEGELQSTIRTNYLARGLVGRVDAGYGDLRRSSRRSGAAPMAGKRLGKTRSGKEKGVYAMVIEFGDPKRNRPPQPYLFPAIEADRPAFESDCRAAVSRVIRRNSRG
jgi:hypothetical protein